MRSLDLDMLECKSSSRTGIILPYVSGQHWGSLHPIHASSCLAGALRKDMAQNEYATDKLTLMVMNTAYAKMTIISNTRKNAALDSSIY